MAEYAFNITEYINELVEELDQIDKELDVIGSKLDLYINNSYNLKKTFDYKEHIIILDSNNLGLMHKILDIEKIAKKLDIEYMEYIENIEEQIINLLPKPLEKIKMNKKQIKKYLYLIEDYNNLFLDYDCLIEEVNDYTDNYNEIIKEVKESLSNIHLTELNDSSSIDPFDNEKHELLIVKNQKNKCQFIYINKKDEEKFSKLIKKDN